MTFSCMRIRSTCKMTRVSVIALIWLLGFSVDAVNATECADLVSGSDLTVSDAMECTVSADFYVATITVQGTMIVTSAGPVTIKAQTIDIQAGARVSADAVVHAGPGQGTTLGSGGLCYGSFYIYACSLFGNYY